MKDVTSIMNNVLYIHDLHIIYLIMLMSVKIIIIIIFEVMIVIIQLDDANIDKFFMDILGSLKRYVELTSRIFSINNLK